MTDRIYITSYLNKRHEVIRKTRSANPVAATERASGYLANQYFRNSKNPRDYAVYAEVYNEETTVQFSSVKFTPGGGKNGKGRVTTDYNDDTRGYETRYAVTPLLEAAD